MRGHSRVFVQIDDLEREDAESYLLVVLDASHGLRADGPVANSPRLVDKHNGEVTRLLVPDAVARAERMAHARQRSEVAARMRPQDVRP